MIELGDKKAEKDYDMIDVLYVGGLSRHKGVHILINAFKELEYAVKEEKYFNLAIDALEQVNPKKAEEKQCSNTVAFSPLYI